MDSLTPEQRHRCMSHIRSTETKPEVFFRKTLWKWNVRYRKNVRGLFGKPDIAIKKYRLVIFIDGDFWHGAGWEKRHFATQEDMLASYNEYWQKKIRRNIERDREVTDYYTKNGWTILRFFESEIKKDLNACIITTIETVNRLKGEKSLTRGLP